MPKQSGSPKKTARRAARQEPVRPRQLVPVSETAPITSRNRPVAGDVGISVNNKTQSMVCDWNEDHTDYGADSQIYKRYWGDYSPNRLIWVWYDNKDISPSDPAFVGTLDGKQETANIDLEEAFLKTNSLPISVSNYKFNDGTKRDTLVIKVPAANKQGFIQYKIIQ